MLSKYISVTQVSYLKYSRHLNISDESEEIKHTATQKISISIRDNTGTWPQTIIPQDTRLFNQNAKIQKKTHIKYLGQI